jgi:lysyl-tRNA synthetase class 1
MKELAPDKQTPVELWPYEEARRIQQRAASFASSRPIIFESGFGPSGLPHLGTLCEVLRPNFVRSALRSLNQKHGDSRELKFILFIDDMDGLRKVPENVPNREQVAFDIGKPVSQIADPFGDCHGSFAEHGVSLLIRFLEPIAVDCELIRSSQMYASGRFDETLRLILFKHAEISAIVTPTLREQNRRGWSPFLPLCPQCGQINSTLVTAYHPDRRTVEFSCERSFGGARGCGFAGEQSILGGKAKVGWKVDWALRWHALEVDYELYGKDLIDSARLSGEIVRLLGGEPPLGFSYELFLDEHGHKVSKSVGRGLTVDQWQRYAPIEVLNYFLFLNPRRARRLFLESIPQYVDDYLNELRSYAAAQSAEARRTSPLEFILQPGSARGFASDLSFGLIMNLVSTLGTSDRGLIWNYLTRYDAKLEADQDTRQLGASLMECALNFYADFVEPTKQRYVPQAPERERIRALADFIRAHPEADGDVYEKAIYDLGRQHYDKPGKIFPLLYRVMLGQDRGPRLGAFIKLVTPARILSILDAALAA